jgi:hypothetical protein
VCWLGLSRSLFSVDKQVDTSRWIYKLHRLCEDLIGYDVKHSSLNKNMYLLCSSNHFSFFFNFPYSVIRGEEFSLEVTIFNYLKDTTELTYSGLLIICTSGKAGRDGELCLAFDTLFLSI